MVGDTKDIFQCVVPKIEGLQGSLHYFVTESEFTIEGCCCKVYGVRVEKKVDEVVKESEEYSEITTLYDDIIHLTELMSRNEVTPVSVSNIIEDYLA